MSRYAMSISDFCFVCIAILFTGVFMLKELKYLHKFSRGKENRAIAEYIPYYTNLNVRNCDE